jgi:cell division initiation protein
MLTPQEVSSHAFPKAVMGGYNMASVDEFLDELTDDYTALYKENAALKAKLKVLVEKVEDYRATEDGMRATLLAAQKMSDSIVHEAEAKRDELLAKAEVDARARIGEMQRELEENQRRMELGRQQVATFVASIRSVCETELKNLSELPELPVEIQQAAPPAEQKAEETADEIEEALLASLEEEPVPAEEAVEPEEEPGQTAVDEPEPQEKPDKAEKKEYPAGNPFGKSGDSMETRNIELGELKFGRNYSGRH